jgi:Tol biopolymer transport system component
MPSSLASPTSRFATVLVSLLAAAGCGAVAGKSGTGGSGGGQATGGTAGTGAGGASSGAGGSGGGAADAAAGGASGTDASADSSDGPATRACDLSKPFSTPAPVAAFNSDQSDDGLWFSSDGLTAYISSSRAGGPGSYDIFKATRASATAAWGQFTAVPNVNSQSLDRSPVLSPDGLTLFLYSNRVNGSGDYDILAATRANLLADFAAAAPVAGLNTTSREDIGSLTADGLTLYFDSDKSGVSRIYRATLAASGAFMTPELVGELNATMGVSSPVISADGLTIFVSATMPTTSGPSDIYVAHRSTTADGFGALAPVTELNSPGIDFVDWLSPDGCTIYLGSNRAVADAGSIVYHIYVASRGQ